MKNLIALRPSVIRYTQNSISARFSDNSRHRGVPIGDTLDDILESRCRISDIPPITVEIVGGIYYSANCRRLWILKKAEELGACSLVTMRLGLLTVKYITTCNYGRKIDIRGNPGGNVWRKLKNLRYKKPMKLFITKGKSIAKGIAEKLKRHQ